MMLIKIAKTHLVSLATTTFAFNAMSIELVAMISCKTSLIVLLLKNKHEPKKTEGSAKVGCVENFQNSICSSTKGTNHFDRGKKLIILKKRLS